MGFTKLAFSSISRRKLRSGLLLLGIVIGVGLLTGMMAAIGSMAKAYQNSMLDTLGKTDLIVRFNSKETESFDFETVQDSLSIDGISGYAVRAQRWFEGSISQTAPSKTPICLIGVQPQVDEEYGEYTVLSGSVQSISEGIDPVENICVITETLADGWGVGVDNYIYINVWSMEASESSEPHRYFIGVSSNNFYLGKQIGDNFYGLTGAPLSLDNGWHRIDIRGYENTLSIYIDNAICALYEDENFIPSGGIAFETLDDSEFLIDNVEICGVEKENVLPSSFFEDFESGTQNWNLEEGWHLEKINNNTVLSGEGHRWATLKDMSWSNYAFRAKFKIIQGSINFNYKVWGGETGGQIQCGLRITAVIRDYGKAYDFDVGDPSKFWPQEKAVFIHIDKAQEIFGTENITHVFIDVADGYETESVKNELQGTLGGQFSICNIEQHMSERAQEQTSGMGMATGMVGFIVFVLVGMLILSVMFTNVTERKYEIGVLRCLGASRPQIFRLVISEGVFIGILGAVVGVGVAFTLLMLFAPSTTTVAGQTVAVELESMPYYASIGLITGILFVTIASIAPAVFAAKVNLIETLRPSMRVPIKKRIKALGLILCATLLTSGAYLIYANVGPGGSATAAAIGFILMLFGLLWATSYFIKYFLRLFSRAFGKLGVLIERNIGRNRIRSVFTYGMIAFCVGMIVIFGSLFSAMMSSAGSIVKYEVGADVAIQVNAPWEFENSIRSMSGVADCAGIACVWDSDISTGGDVLPNVKVRVLGVNSANYFSTVYEVRLNEILDGFSEDDVFTKISSENGYIIVQDRLLTKIGLNLGDNVIRVTEEGSRVNFEIIATTNLISGAWETLWPDQASRQGGYVAIVSADDLARDRAEFFYVSAEEGVDTESLAEEIRELCRANGYAVEKIQTEAQQKELYEKMFEGPSTLITLMTLMMLLFGGLGIAVATVYTVIERRREIGVTRACGVGRGQSIFIFTGEAFVLGLIGFCVGLSVGLPFSYLLFSVAPGISPVVPWGFIFPWAGIGYAFVACVLAASIAAAYPAYKISKLKVTDALRR